MKKNTKIIEIKLTETDSELLEKDIADGNTLEVEFIAEMGTFLYMRKLEKREQE